MITLPRSQCWDSAPGTRFASNLLKKQLYRCRLEPFASPGEDLQAHGLSLHATPQQAVADAG